MKTVRSEVERVLRSDACSGCGLCPVLDSGLKMELNDSGYLRPRVVGPVAQRKDAVRIFRRACPGVRVDAVRPAGSARTRCGVRASACGKRGQATTSSVIGGAAAACFRR